MHTKNYISPAKKCFSGKCFNAHQIRFAVKKSKKMLVQFSKFFENFFVSPSKDAVHTISIYVNCMVSIFFIHLMYRSV